MPTAVIVDAVRTPLGKRNGGLSTVHPVDLAAEVLIALVARTGLDPALVDDVILGCVGQVGAQSANVGRLAVLAAGWPESVPGTTVDRQCGSSQQAIHFAAQAVMSGVHDVVVAGGVENMSMVPMGSTAASRDFGPPGGPRYRNRYRGADGKQRLVPQGISAEMIAAQWGITREECDAFSVESHRRAAQATDEGRFARQIVPITVPATEGAEGRIADGPTVMSVDEGFRRGTTVEALAKLKPSFQEDGLITAGNSSQISDGASAALIMSEERAAALGLVPRARFHALALAGSDPVLMLTAPIPATTKVLERAKLTLDDIDVIEINEAFAPVVLAWAKEHHPDMARVNPNGGAIAIGHPLGGSGGRLFATLLDELERTGGRYGLQTMCEGGGMANATIIERLG
jgi:acetyl-CoA acyltransferase